MGIYKNLIAIFIGLIIIMASMLIGYAMYESFIYTSPSSIRYQEDLSINSNKNLTSNIFVIPAGLYSVVLKSFAVIPDGWKVIATIVDQDLNKSIITFLGPPAQNKMIEISNGDNPTIYYFLGTFLLNQKSNYSLKLYINSTGTTNITNSGKLLIYAGDLYNDFIIGLVYLEVTSILLYILSIFTIIVKKSRKNNFVHARVTGTSICIQCGKEVNLEDDFCFYCGEKTKP